jgi:hypothetical protein
VVLYWCETWPLTLLEIHRLRVFQNGVLRKIFGPKRDEVIGGKRKLHNEKLRNLYSSLRIIRIIKSRRMRSIGIVAQMGRREMHIGFWWESQKERDLDAHGRIILKWILERLDGVVWTVLIWLRLETSGGHL